MDPFGNLSFENGTQIRKYLRFFAQKKEGIIRTINNEFTDAKTDKLNEEMYTRDDVDDFCDFLSTAVRVSTLSSVKSCYSLSFFAVVLTFLSLLLLSVIKNNVTHEVATVINMSALAVSQLLESAQDKGVELELETSALENEALLKEVDKMTLDALPTKPKVPQRLGTLKSFKDDAKALKDETGRVDEVNKRLTQQVQELQSQISLLNRQLREERNATTEGR